MEEERGNYSLRGKIREEDREKIYSYLLTGRNQGVGDGGLGNIHSGED